MGERLERLASRAAEWRENVRERFGRLSPRAVREESASVKSAVGTTPFWRSRWVAVAMLSVVSAAAITFLASHMQSFTVRDGAERYVISTLSTDPTEALAVAGLSVGEYDQVRRAGAYNELTIDRSFIVRLTVDGVTTAVRMTDGTVGDALQQAGVNLAGYRLINAQVTDAASDGLDICVESALTYTERTEVETLDYDVETRYTATLPKGRVNVVQAGREGTLTRTLRDTVVDGEVTESVVLDEVREEPVNEIREVGTFVGGGSTPLSAVPESVVLDEAGLPLNYSRVLTGKCTAYTSDRGLAGKRTASGRAAAVGVVAVDPREIPYGTELYITSADGSYIYGYAVAGDTGSAMRSGRALCDLYMDTYEQCIAFGRRTMNIYVLN